MKFVETSIGIRYIRANHTVNRYMPFLHIIVLGYGRFQQNSQACLASLLPIPNDVEVTIFDNGSPDDSPSQQTEFIHQHPEIHSVLNPKNLGFAGGMNQAVQQLESNCEWLMLVGNDTIFHPQALGTFLSALPKASPKVGIVGPMTNSAGTAQGLMTLGEDSKEVFKRWNQLPQSTEIIFSPLYRADFFCVAIRKSLWDALGGLDLSYGRGYYEDFDFCMRAKQQGFDSAMLVNALVFHQGSASFKNDPTQSQLIKNNKLIFTQKFPSAQLRHRRLDHYLTLEHDLHGDQKNQNDQRRSQLAQLRIETLMQDLPKSPIKRWLWKRRIVRVAKEFQRFNVSKKI